MAQDDSLRILVVDDDDEVRATLRLSLESEGHAVDESANANAALKLAEKDAYDVILADVRMPRMDGLDLLKALQTIDPTMLVIMITGHATMDVAIQALRLGASDFLTKPIKLQELTAAIEKMRRLRALQAERSQLRGALGAIQKGDATRKLDDLIIGASELTAELRAQVELTANSDCRSILITGETGTGKEVVAHAIHAIRHESTDPFIAVNCPALPDTLVESELFGHKRGAFTGAVSDRLGAFELAHHGTLFLDEASDLSRGSQAKLLRVLETRKIRRIGDNRERDIDVTLIAATNQDLMVAMQNGDFRSDLYYRLNVFEIRIPALRARPDDILPLAHHFLGKYYRTGRPGTGTITAPAEELLLNYAYPGNVRELRNIVERAAMLSRGGTIESTHLLLPDTSPVAISTSFQSPAPYGADEEVTTLAALQQKNWNRRDAARQLGISYDAIRWRIKKHGLKR